MKNSLMYWLIISVVCFCILISGSSFVAAQHIIPSGQLIIDGKPDADLENKALLFELTQSRIGGGIGPYVVYVCYDAENIYVACEAVDDSVSCKDETTEDFMDSDYLRFYICVDDDFKGRQALNGESDWAIIFTPQDTDDNWIPMVKECPYNGPGHGAITGDDVTAKRASGAVADGWYLEAAVPFSLLGTTREELSKITFGVYFIAGDTDAGGTRTGEVSLGGAAGGGNYWNSPDFWQESKLGEYNVAVDIVDKAATMWGRMKLSQ
jgi:hypothetical protein